MAAVGPSYSDRQRAVCAAICESMGMKESECRCYVRDLFDDTAAFESDGTLYLVDYTIESDGTASVGTPKRARVSYEVIASPKFRSLRST